MPENVFRERSNSAKLAQMRDALLEFQHRGDDNEATTREVPLQRGLVRRASSENHHQQRGGVRRRSYSSSSSSNAHHHHRCHLSILSIFHGFILGLFLTVTLTTYILLREPPIIPDATNPIAATRPTLMGSIHPYSAVRVPNAQRDIIEGRTAATKATTSSTTGVGESSTSKPVSNHIDSRTFTQTEQPQGEQHYKIIQERLKILRKANQQMKRKCRTDGVYVQHMNHTVNHITELVHGWKPHQQNYTNTQSTPLPPAPVLLWIGDSQDRFQVDPACNYLEGTGVVNIHAPNSTNNRAIAKICHSPWTGISMAYFGIFGMHHECNVAVAHGMDPRGPFATQADRVRALLPSVLQQLGKIPTHVQMGSNLWDLSEGPQCNYHGNGISFEYQKMYRRGMHDLAQAVRDVIRRMAAAGHDGKGRGDNPHLFPRLYWRTAMPVTEEYSANAVGRTLANQAALNQILRDEVTIHNSNNNTSADGSFGELLDHWATVKAAPHECCVRPDGRHYKDCASLAFFNSWLDAIYSATPRSRTTTA